MFLIHAPIAPLYTRHPDTPSSGMREREDEDEHHADMQNRQISEHSSFSTPIPRISCRTHRKPSCRRNSARFVPLLQNRIAYESVLIVAAWPAVRREPVNDCVHIRSLRAPSPARVPGHAEFKVEFAVGVTRGGLDVDVDVDVEHPNVCGSGTRGHGPDADVTTHLG